jgi:mono/diheme cytochrome c family protein
MHAQIWMVVILLCAPMTAACKQAEVPARAPTRGSLEFQGMGPGMMGRGMMGRGMMTGSVARHHEAMTNGIPEPYRSSRDPLPDDAKTLHSGARVYEQYCAACHGERGLGDGPTGQQLRPPAANLASLARTSMGQSDSYLYWTIAEGGQQFGTAMPPFKGALSSDEMWAVIHYLKQGLPQNTRRP